MDWALSIRTDGQDVDLVHDVPLHSMDGEDSIIPRPDGPYANLTERFITSDLYKEYGSLDFTSITSRCRTMRPSKAPIHEFEEGMKEVLEQVDYYKWYGQYKKGAISR